MDVEAGGREGQPQPGASCSSLEAQRPSRARKFKNKILFNCANILPRGRHCSQEYFKIVVVGGISTGQVFNFIIAGGENESTDEVVRDAFSIDSTNFLNGKIVYQK